MLKRYVVNTWRNSAKQKDSVQKRLSCNSCTHSSLLVSLNVCMLCIWNTSSQVMSFWACTLLNWFVSKGGGLGCLANVFSVHILSSFKLVSVYVFWVWIVFYSIYFFKCGCSCVIEWVHPWGTDVWVCFWSPWETDVIIPWTLVGHSSLFSRQGLSVTIWISFFLSTSLFIPSSLLIYPSLPPPSADAHPDVSESSLNHSLTERGKERGDGGRDKGAWEIEREKREGWGLERTWNEPINPGCLLSCVKCLSLADA